MATPATLPSPAPRATTVVVHADLVLDVAPAGPSTTTITARDAAGTALGVLASVETTTDTRASATLVAAALTAAVDIARTLWPAG